MATKHAAGAFDIRNMIGALMGIYGLILVGMGLFGDKELDRTGGINANLWGGLGLLTIAAIFLLWARARPLLVPEKPAEPEDAPPAAH